MNNPRRYGRAASADGALDREFRSASSNSSSTAALLADRICTFNNTHQCTLGSLRDRVKSEKLWRPSDCDIAVENVKRLEWPSLRKIASLSRDRWTNAPASKILTAYELLRFHDLPARVKHRPFPPRPIRFGRLRNLVPRCVRCVYRRRLLRFNTFSADGRDKTVVSNTDGEVARLTKASSDFGIQGSRHSPQVLRDDSPRSQRASIRSPREKISSNLFS
jgi:hypothetical protein